MTVKVGDAVRNLQQKIFRARRRGEGSILLAYVDLKEAMAQPGCPLCRLAARTERRYLSSFLYENVLDVGVREALRSAWGFCPQHTWMLYEIEQEEYHDGMGTAIVHEDLLGRVAEVLERYTGGTHGGEAHPGGVSQRDSGRQPAGRGGMPSRLAGWGRFFSRRPGESRHGEIPAALAPTGVCPACAHVASMEEINIHEVLAHLEDEDFLARLRGSPGLCLPHFLKVVQAAAGPAPATGERLEALIKIQLDQVRQLRRELSEYLRKHSYEYAHEPKGAEQTSPRRAVEKMVGSRLAGQTGLATETAPAGKKRTRPPPADTTAIKD